MGMMGAAMSEQQITVTAEITPEIMAKAFWDMSCAEQADFFHELGKLTAENQFHAQTQWLWMTHAIRDRKNNNFALNCFLSFTAYAYDFWPKKTESQFMENSL